MRLATLAVSAQVKANHLQPTVIQGLDPAEIRIVVLEADGAPVDKNHRVSAPVDFIVNVEAVVLDGGHGALLGGEKAGCCG
jgi:hypothetical protein